MNRSADFYCRSAPAEEESILVAFLDGHQFAVFQIIPDFLECGLGNRDEALFVSFPDDADESLVKIDVRQA